MGRPFDLKTCAERKCCVCKVVKPLSEFHRNKSASLGREYDCNSCTTEYRKWSKVKREFGITKDQYFELLSDQGGVCAICKLPERIKRRKDHRERVNMLAVDHDHKTGKVRGLLCNQCNVGVGNFSENTASLRMAISYLEGHS